MLRTQLLKLREERYDTEAAKNCYQNLKESFPDNRNEALDIHIQKLDDLMENYDSQKDGYTLRNLVEFCLLPEIDKNQQGMLAQ